MYSTRLLRTSLAVGCAAAVIAIGSTWASSPGESGATAATSEIGAAKTEPAKLPAAAVEAIAAQTTIPPKLAPAILVSENPPSPSFLEVPAADPGEIDAGIKAYRDGDYRKARDLLASHTDDSSAALNYLRAGLQLSEFGPNDLEMLKALAGEKNGAAARMLADFYRAGKFVPADPNQAASLYMTAIEAGDTRSLLRLAQLYDEAGNVDQAIAAYKKAIASFPEKELRYLYLVASSTDAGHAARTKAAAKLDQLAATDLTAARVAFDLYRKHDVPGADRRSAIAAAEAAYALGAHDLGLYVASACISCTADEIQSAVEQSTNFNDARRTASALARLARIDRPDAVIATLDKLPQDKSLDVGLELAKRLGLSNPAVALVQTRLQTAGLYRGKVDGVLGPKTLAALRKSSAMAGGDLKLTSPELFSWVISRPVAACQTGEAGGECSL